ncbi:MAG: hypothetical protein ACR2NR_00650, partial [Solirubrobacteraceae bacterium]
AAVTAAAFAAWTYGAVAGVSGALSLPPAAVALVAGSAVLLLPRLGWAAITVTLCAGAIIQHHSGAALVIAIAALVPVVLMPARPSAWPLSAVAPALGLIGLAGAWPAIASRARGPSQRAALGAVGWVWLLLAGALSGQTLYLPHISGAPLPSVWIGSLQQTTTHLLSVDISAGVLAPAIVWAVAAMIAPWLVRGQAPVLDVFRVFVWSALLVSATSAAVVIVHGSDAVGSAPTAVLGAAAGAVVALIGLAPAQWRRAGRFSPLGARLP